MTDLEVIQDNLRYNAQKNAKILKSRGVNVRCDVLDWMDPEKQLPLCWNKEFEVRLFGINLQNFGH